MGRRRFKKRENRRSIRPPAARPSSAGTLSVDRIREEAQGFGPLAVAREPAESESEPAASHVAPRASDAEGSGPRAAASVRSGMLPPPSAAASEASALSIEGALQRLASEPPTDHRKPLQASGAQPEKPAGVKPEESSGARAEAASTIGESGPPARASEPGAASSVRSEPPAGTSTPPTPSVAAGPQERVTRSAAAETGAATEAEPSGESSDRVSLNDLLAVDDGTRDFFISSNHPPADYHVDSWVPPQPMSGEARRAMWVSAGLLALSVIGIGGYLIYHKLIMPTPVTLGAAGGPSLEMPVPTAESYASLPPSVAAVPSPSPRLAVETPTTGTAPPADTHAPDSPSLDEASNGASNGAQAQGQVGGEREPGAPAGAAESADEQPPSEPMVDDQPSETAALAEELAAGGSVEGEQGDRAEGAESAPAPGLPTPLAAPPEAPSAEAELSYRDQLKVAGKLMKRWKYDEALTAYEKALGYWPEGPRALTKIAYLHLQGSRNGKARTYAHRAVTNDPSNSEAWIVLGAALQALREPQAAKEAYRRCSEQASGKYVLECRRMAR